MKKINRKVLEHWYEIREAREKADLFLTTMAPHMIKRSKKRADHTTTIFNLNLFAGSTTPASCVSNSTTPTNANIEKLNNLLTVVPQMMSGENCAYCQKYGLEFAKCRGCPIKKLTGKSHCLDTPYRSALYNPTLKNIDNEIAFVEMVVGLDECGALEVK